MHDTPSQPGGSGQCNSRHALHECLGVAGNATPAVRCHTALGLWAVQLLRQTPHCLGAMGSATPATQYHTASGEWEVQLLQHTPPLPWGTGHCKSCSALPHRLGGGGVVQFLQRTTKLPGGSGQWKS